MTGDDPQTLRATIQTLETRLEASREETLAARAAARAAELAVLEARVTADRRGEAPRAPSFWRQHGTALLAAGLMAPLIVALILMHHDATTRAQTCEARLRGEVVPDQPEVGDPPAPHTTPTAITTPDPPAEVGDSVGVPECDDYLIKFSRCTEDKIPAASRAMMKRSAQTMREAWRRAAQTEEGRNRLAQACAMAKRTARKSMASFNCQW